MATHAVRPAKARRRRDVTLVVLVGLAVVWCDVLPFVWAHNVDHLAHLGYWRMLALYVPELAVGGMVLICLPLLILRSRIAAIGLLLAAILGPLLRLAVGSPAGELWPVSFILLSLLSWNLHVRFARRAPDARAHSD